MPPRIDMGWLRFVDSLAWYVSCAKEPYKRDDILQKRPLILSSLLIVATPYVLSSSLMSLRYIYITQTQTCTPTHIHVYMCVYVYPRVAVCVCILVWIYVASKCLIAYELCANTYICIRIYIYINICVCIHTYIHMYIHKCIYTYIYAHMYTYTHVCINIYICNDALRHICDICIHMWHICM